MAKKAMEMTIEIAGKVGSSLGASFKRASGEVDDLKKKSLAAKRELSRLGREFSKGNIHQSQYAAETKKVRSELRKLEGDMRRTKAVSTMLNNGVNKVKATARIAAVGATAAAAVAIGSSVKTAASYEAQMSKVGAVSGATKKELAKMDDFALELSKSSIFTATQAGQGMEYLALAGWKSKEIMAGMPGMLNLAAAGNLDLGRAADITSDTMSAFGMKAMEAGHAADVFAYAQANANTNVEQMGDMMKYAAPISNQMKWSLEETSAAAMVMADSGLKGSIAGQAFASSVSRLSKPTREMRKKMKELNIEFFDADDKMKSMPDVIASLEKGFDGLSDKQRSAALTTLFGAEAYKHWAILLEGGSDKLRGLTKDLETADGAAAKMSAEMVDNYAGSLKLLQASVETAQIKLMKPILPVFQDLFDGIGGMLDGKTGEIESVGERTAKALGDVFEPFSLKKPEMQAGVKYSHEELKEYQEELKRYYERQEIFGDMDLGDKIVYSLETAMGKAEEWLAGSGGEMMGRVFTTLGEIAAKSWWNAFKGAVGGSLEAMGEGNIGGALGLGAAGWMLGGGAMVKGAIGAGRWAVESRSVKKSKAAAKAMQDTAPVSSGKTKEKKQKGSKKTKSKAVASQPVVQERKAAKTKQTAKAAPAPKNIVKNTGKSLLSGGGKLAGKIAKIGSKAMLPLAFANEAFNVIKSKDKAKAGGEAAGGLAGTLGGGKLGAAIGTAVAPGIGTAVGGLIGGIGGYIGGKWLGGKAVDTARGDGGKSEKATAGPPAPSAGNPSESTSFDSAALNAAANELAASLTASTASMTELQTGTSAAGQSMTAFASHIEQAGGTMQTSFAALQESSNATAHNISALAMILGEASGMLYGSMSSLQSNADMTAHSMSLLTTYTSQASGMIYGSFASLQSNAELTAHSMSLLATYTSRASGMIYGPFASLQSNAEITAHSMSLLATYTSQASGMMYGSFSGLQTSTTMTTHSMSLLTSYIGQAGGMLNGLFVPLRASAGLASSNMSNLAARISQASGWISSLSGIPAASQRVVAALGNLEARINSVPLPSGGGGGKRVSFDG
ncbi:phage tail tape measure protein [Sporosarcina sp. P37]|uniref:phage tail tape measure protein n=1 Tax=unclassified Sporosarcina TaxID=2647733 RepID=UPI000A17DC60|nr:MULTISPECIES: phage tail tape measure protein [unclassified Sporosarcina]ARK26006.1 phage tail tape measure protein [Sporosarcina sp. P37]PID19374.1 phage tail tape measure protein [Sporosarcina sp. P35]